MLPAAANDTLSHAMQWCLYISQHGFLQTALDGLLKPEPDASWLEKEKSLAAFWVVPWQKTLATCERCSLQGSGKIFIFQVSSSLRRLDSLQNNPLPANGLLFTCWAQNVWMMLPSRIDELCLMFVSHPLALVPRNCISSGSLDNAEQSM